LVKDESAEGW